ncbi:MAG: hypothetical protein WD795_19265 [Woeseia sp.]
MFYSGIASIVFAVAVAAGLGACASTPKYAPADDVDGYGHYSTQLSENRYRVVYNGSRSTSLNTTRDYAMLRAAELTMREGYDWFRIVDRETVSFSEPQPQSGFSYERTYYVERSCGLLSCSQSVRPWTTTQLDMRSDRARTKHSHVLEIVIGKGELPEDDSDYYQADAVARSLVESM